MSTNNNLIPIYQSIKPVQGRISGVTVFLLFDIVSELGRAITQNYRGSLLYESETRTRPDERSIAILHMEF
ncbi:hypothetical protein K0M31_020308, partial [Melipona bicolor]